MTNPKVLLVVGPDLECVVEGNRLGLDCTETRISSDFSASRMTPTLRNLDFVTAAGANANLLDIQAVALLLLPEMELPSDLAGPQGIISQALIHTTRSVAQVCHEDVPFHRSLDPMIGTAVDIQSSRLLLLAQRLLQRCTSTHDSERVRLSDIDSIDSNWRSVVDAADSLLERTDSCLDEFSGLLKQSTPRDGGASPVPTIRPTRKGNFYHAANLPKPQLSFDTRPENFTTTPFMPILTSKPHASIPLDNSLALRQNEHDTLQCLHPYASEIGSYEYPSYVYTYSDPIPCVPFDTTTATFVDDFSGVLTMLEELKEASLIAVDLEHHDTHSYIGIVSLMQISTRNHDWIIDTLKPWRRKLEVLNEVFADPNIMKVLHGAHMDIMWLQRDLGLYVVGLFDTHHASRALGYPGGSLAYLLKRFVDFDAQKQYQTADWRLRPLPPEMFDYARSDTHFLLYIFDNMRNDLVRTSNFEYHDQDKVQTVLGRSKETALQRYEHQVYDADRGLGRNGWFEQLQRAPDILSKEQFAVYRRVHQWRDTVARHEDESPHQIMPKHVLASLAQNMPGDMPTLLGISHPITSYVRYRANELLEVIQTARTTASDGPGMHELLTIISRDLGLRIPHYFEPSVKVQGHASAPRDVRWPDNIAEVRSTKSHLWGCTLPSMVSVSQVTRSQSALFAITPSDSGTLIEAAQIVVPHSLHSSPTIQSDCDPSSKHSPSEARGKRKNTDLATNESAIAVQGRESGFIGATSTQEELTEINLSNMQQRTSREAAKRARMGARKLSSSALDAETSGLFDYSHAASVLHSAIGDDKGVTRLKHKHFDPRQKALDAPAGMKKGHIPKAGRSHTFGK